MRAARIRPVLAAALLAMIWIAHPARVSAAGNLQVLAVPGGQPDDITVDPRGRLLWGNLSRGTIERLQGGRVVTIARGLSVPEGLLALRDGSLILAEQGPDRIDRIGPRGHLSVLYRLAPVAGQEGVDGIGWDTRSSSLLVPDSPRGALLRYNLKTHRVRVLTTKLGRPVDAALDHAGNILVPDEHLGTLAVIGTRGRVTYRGRFATPDDVAVDGAGRIWVTTLGDNSLWSISPHGVQHLAATGLQNPQGMRLDRCGDPVVVEQGAGRIVRVLLTPRSRTCRF